MQGLDDTVGIRVAATHAQIDACDVIWIVAHIDRAITNTTIDNLLGRYAEAFKGNVAVILTRSDADITDGVIEHLKRERCDLRAYNKALKEEKLVRKMKKRRGKQVLKRQQKLASRKMRDMTYGQKAKMSDELENYSREYERLKGQLPEVITKRFSMIVDTRNAYVTQRLRAERQDHMPEGKELPVICISNIHYQALKRGTRMENDMLSAEATGVPALRQHVYTMVAPYLLRVVEDFIDHKCEVFMRGLGFWARSIVIEGGAQFMEIVNAPSRTAKPRVETYVSSILDEAEQMLVKPLSHKQKKFADQAVSVLETKKSWAWGTIRAFCRKNGNHSTSVMPKESWNEQFLEAANKITRIEWDDFVGRQAKTFDALKEDIIMLLEGIITELRSKTLARLCLVPQLTLSSSPSGCTSSATEDRIIA